MAGMLQRVIDDAKEVRANTMDLRWPVTDVPLWLDAHRPVWNDFAPNGGHRLAPKSLSVPTEAMVNLAFLISQTWVNGGLGRLPNSRAVGTTSTASPMPCRMMPGRSWTRPWT